MINYFRAVEGRRTTVSYSFMPKLLLTKLLENEKDLPKVAPAIVVFVHCEGS